MKSTDHTGATMTPAHSLTTLDLEAIEALMATAAGYKPGYFDEDYITFTDETLESFAAARNNYNEAGRLVSQSDTHLHIDSAQVRAGNARVEVVVIDLGDVRAAVIY
jgi:hypothetical protein